MSSSENQIGEDQATATTSRSCENTSAQGGQMQSASFSSSSPGENPGQNNSLSPAKANNTGIAPPDSSGGYPFPPPTKPKNDPACPWPETSSPCATPPSRTRKETKTKSKEPHSKGDAMLSESRNMTTTTFREDPSGLDHSAIDLGGTKGGSSSREETSSSRKSRSGNHPSPTNLFFSSNADLEAGGMDSNLTRGSRVVTTISRAPMHNLDEEDGRSDIADTSMQMHEEEKKMLRQQIIFAVLFTVVLFVGVGLCVYFQLRRNAP